MPIKSIADLLVFAPKLSQATYDRFDGLRYEIENSAQRALQVAIEDTQRWDRISNKTPSVLTGLNNGRAGDILQSVADKTKATLLIIGQEYIRAPALASQINDPTKFLGDLVTALAELAEEIFYDTLFGVTFRDGFEVADAKARASARRILKNALNELARSELRGEFDAEDERAGTAHGDRYRSTVNRWMKTKDFPNNKAASRHLAVSSTVFAAIRRGDAVAKGRCSINTVERIAKAMGLQPSDIDSSVAITKITPTME